MPFWVFDVRLRNRALLNNNLKIIFEVSKNIKNWKNHINLILFCKILENLGLTKKKLNTRKYKEIFDLLKVVLKLI